MTAAVVQFPAPKRRPRKVASYAASQAFNLAWEALPELSRLRSSRKQSIPEWQIIAAEIGEPALLAAVLRYIAEDKEHRREHGAPGFHRWLNWGRWEHWLCEPRPEAPRFKPEPYRARFVQLLGEDFVRSWIDQCVWKDGRLIAPRQFSVDTLRRTFSAHRINVAVEDFKEQSANQREGMV